jgi:serine/threonine protein kinase
MKSAPRRLGRYEILRSLAQGGMAELFVARLAGIEGFARQLVLKRVLPNLARDREFVDMFLGEARLAATLHHQNVVQVLDIGQDDDGFFFAMELLHGADVGELLRRTNAALPFSIALEVIRGACAGLHYAHERSSPQGAALGIVHRDVSPQNLFVTFDGGVKVLDFGIAKAAHQISNHFTRSGTLRGKLPYMSPEQCRGEPIDRRSDIFSLAIVLWEITVGERLFGATNQSDFEILKSVIEQDAPRPSSRRADYPPHLEKIVMKGLQREPSARFQSADELQAELETFIRMSSSWASTRDVARYMRDLFPDRAAAWREAERHSVTVPSSPGGEIVPFPRPVTRVATPENTLDLPQQAPVAPFADTRPAPKVAVSVPPQPPRAPRRNGLVIGLAVFSGLCVIAVAVLVGYLARGGSPTPAPEEAPIATKGSAKKGPAKPGSGSLLAQSFRGPEGEDLHWFQPDDFLVSQEKFKGARLNNLHVAKMTKEPERPGGEATFLLANDDGVKTTTTYWKTRIATAEELVIDVQAFCRGNWDWKNSDAPTTKDEARQHEWVTGKITDTTELTSGKVMVGNLRCDLDGVRVIDTRLPD